MPLATSMEFNDKVLCPYDVVLADHLCRLSASLCWMIWPTYIWHVINLLIDHRLAFRYCKRYEKMLTCLGWDIIKSQKVRVRLERDRMILIRVFMLQGYYPSTCFSGSRKGKGKGVSWPMIKVGALFSCWGWVKLWQPSMFD